MKIDDLTEGEKNELAMAAFLAEYPVINREKGREDWAKGVHHTTVAMCLEQACFVIRTWEAQQARRRALNRETKLYFFGCANRAVGHYLFEAWEGGGVDTCRGWKVGPWEALDGKLVPEKIRGQNQPQGQAYVTHKNGWTALSFWDRSVDKRHGSNFSLIVDKETGGEEILELARRRMPKVMERFAFEIKIVNVDGEWV
jgi:hypothetical protein